MKNRVLTLVMALALLTVSIPAAANHTSVGGEDTVGTRITADEAPGNPSVEGTADDGKEDSPFGLGTATSCTEADQSKLNAEEAQTATEARGFCGELVYHEDNGQLLQKSPTDQDLPKPDELISSFDVVRADYVGGASLSYCYVFCDFFVGGTQVFNAFHTVGQQAGITEGPQEADKKDGDRYFTTSYAVTYSSASSIVEANADTWRMNGWANPQALETFAGFIKDGGGNTVDEERLGELFTKATDDLGLSFPDGTTRPTLCGFTPDGQISINAADQGICEIDFSYVSDGENFTDGGDFKDGYNNEPCKSPTYVCGAANSYWQATLVCTAGNGIVLTDPCTDTNGPTDNEYTRFHWVVAPTQSDCGGLQEPGFKTNPSSGDLPYLAHDLDVYVPPTSVNGIDSTQGVESTQDYLTQAQNSQTPVDTRPRPVIDSALDTQLPETPETAETSNVGKADRVEPNAEGEHGTGLSEDSQIEDASGKPSGKCAPFITNTDEEFVDDWKNIVDTDTLWKGTYGTTAVSDNGLYQNSDPNQDNNNDPGPTTFYTDGQVGMFRDANDDGDYDQVDDEDLFSNIQQVGAYPLFWDMRVDGDGNIDESAGCTFGFGDTKLPEMMDNATYGPQTGLVQAIYLKEPTAVISGADVVDRIEGNNIFLFESQAIHEYRTNVSGTQQADTYVQSIIDGLKSHSAVPSGASVVPINDVVDKESAFAPQCQEDTGGFTTTVSLVHDCSADCSGDTIATGYLAQLKGGAQIGSSQGQIPFFQPDGSNTHTFSTVDSSGFLKWTDVDPFDGNPDRNDDSNDRPQHHPSGSSPGDRHHQN